MARRNKCLLKSPFLPNEGGTMCIFVCVYLALILKISHCKYERSHATKSTFHFLRAQPSITPISSWEKSSNAKEFISTRISWPFFKDFQSLLPFYILLGLL